MDVCAKMVLYLGSIIFFKNCYFGVGNGIFFWGGGGGWGCLVLVL